MIRSICFFPLFFVSVTALGQTTVPHTFQSGQPARAAEVNENFDALASALGPVVLDGNDNEIGQLVSIGENFWDLVAINQSGYIQSVSFRDGTIGTGALVYASTDCSGTPYAMDTFGGHVRTYFDAVGNPGLYYIDKSALPISNFSTGSLSFDGTCFVQGSTGSTVWPVSINDPAVTGVSSGTYALPIRIERVN